MAKIVPTFLDFKKGPGGAMARGLGVNLEACTSWPDFTLACIRANHSGAFVEAATDCYGTASTGERLMLCALLHAGDFSAQADDLAEGKTWWRMGHTGGDHGDAVIACIARREA